MFQRPALLSLALALPLSVIPGAASADPALPAAPPATLEAPGATPTPEPTDARADAIADRVQAFYDQTRTFQADFTQQYTIKAYNKRKESRGRLAFEKAGKMSFRYTTNGNRVVSDGKLLRVYEEENEQMYEQPMDQSQYPAALSFLVGGGNVKKSFRLSLLDPEKASFPGGHVLVGEPREPTPAYQKILLYVDGKTAQVRRVLILDAQGNRNRFDFVNPVVNRKTAADEFRFTPPAGTRIVRP